jgi:phosphoribosyl 1,2-cyclic phosphate phosphodiesterase
MKLEVLGSGTSFGVPMIGCACTTCISEDVRDKRNRASSLITFENGENVLTMTKKI